MTVQKEGEMGVGLKEPCFTWGVGNPFFGIVGGGGEPGLMGHWVGWRWAEGTLFSPPPPPFPVG